MQFFTDDVIVPYLRECGYHCLCEIGAQSGGNTDKFLGSGADHLTIIDPCFDADLVEKYQDHPIVSVRRGRSLDIRKPIQQMPPDWPHPQSINGSQAWGV